MPGRQVLYVSYDGALDPLGQAQVIPYLQGLAASGHAITLISFEKRERWQSRADVDALRASLGRAGIRWRPLRYHKRWSVAATAYDVAAGFIATLGAARGRQRPLIHARSYVAGLIALLVKRTRGGKFIFDMRGFWVDERVDGGLWRAGGGLYRAAKQVERRLFRSADVVVSLTAAGADVIRAFPYWRSKTPVLAVIPTCVDLDRFTPPKRARPAAREAMVIGYLGSLGTWYLFDEMIALFKTAQRARPGSIFFIVSPTDRAWIEERLRRHQVPDSAYRIERVSRDEVPNRVASFDVSLAFYRAGSSRKGTCPTKLGESLACGVPVIATAGIGDVDALLAQERVGTVIDRLDDEGCRAAWVRMEALLAEGPALSARCRAAAQRFSLAKGIEQYDALYRQC